MRFGGLTLFGNSERSDLVRIMTWSKEMEVKTALRKADFFVSENGEVRYVGKPGLLRTSHPLKESVAYFSIDADKNYRLSLQHTEIRALRKYHRRIRRICSSA